VILTCPGCAVRFVIPRRVDELRDMEVTHPACGHAFAPFAEPPPAPVAMEAPSFAFEARAADDLSEDQGTDEDESPARIDTHRLRKELTQATTIPFRQLIPGLAATGFACAAAAELVFLFDHGDLPAAHFTLAMLGMGR
jgi:hypothetical protein